MARIFIVHPVKQDISAANSYGEQTFINQKYVYGDKLGPDGTLPHFFLTNMYEAVKHFNPAEDHLVLVGDHVQLVAFTALLAQKFDAFRVLRYDREANGYISVKIQRQL